MHLTYDSDCMYNHGPLVVGEFRQFTDGHYEHDGAVILLPDAHPNNSEQINVEIMSETSVKLTLPVAGKGSRNCVQLLADSFRGTQEEKSPIGLFLQNNRSQEVHYSSSTSDKHININFGRNLVNIVPLEGGLPGTRKLGPQTHWYEEECVLNDQIVKRDVQAVYWVVGFEGMCYKKIAHDKPVSLTEQSAARLRAFRAKNGPTEEQLKLKMLEEQLH